MTSTSENILPKWEQAYKIQEEMNEKFAKIKFDKSINVYNPTIYAANLYKEFLKKYLNGTKDTLLLGLNPGPKSSFKTGIAFVSPIRAREILQLTSDVNNPVQLGQENIVENLEQANPRDRNPEPNNLLIDGILFTHPEETCDSSRRLWKALALFYSDIDTFFHDNFILNYCTLAFFRGVHNKTPFDLFSDTTNPTINEICDICNDGLVKLIELIEPKKIICFGYHCRNQVQIVQAKKPTMSFEIIRITHPSPLTELSDDQWIEVARGPLKSHYLPLLRL